MRNVDDVVLSVITDMGETVLPDGRVSQKFGVARMRIGDLPDAEDREVKRAEVAAVSDEVYAGYELCPAGQMPQQE